MEIIKYAPILIPTMNRYAHFKRCVESIASNNHADKTELVIGLDYPPDEKYISGWRSIIDYIPTIKGFAKVTVLRREYNYGATRNWYDLKDYARKYYDRFISTEDDNEFSPNFLDYMNKALEAYKDHPKVLGVCGYNYLNIDMTGYNREYYFSHEMSAWGWGSWFNVKCDNVEMAVKEPDYLYKLVKEVPFNTFVKDGTKRCNLLFDIGLDYRGDAYYTYYEWNYDMYCMFPKVSLVRNWGRDGSGLHCGTTGMDEYGKQQIDNRTTFDCPFDLPVIYDPRIKKILGSFQRGSIKKRILKIALLIMMKFFVKLRKY